VQIELELYYLRLPGRFGFGPDLGRGLGFGLLFGGPIFFSGFFGILTPCYY